MAQMIAEANAAGSESAPEPAGPLGPPG